MASTFKETNTEAEKSETNHSTEHNKKKKWPKNRSQTHLCLQINGLHERNGGRSLGKEGGRREMQKLAGELLTPEQNSGWAGKS